MTKLSRKTFLGLYVCVLGCASVSRTAFGDDGHIPAFEPSKLRFAVQLVNVDSRVEKSSFPGVPGSYTEASSDTKPGATVAYIFNSSWAIETYLVIPFETDIRGAGTLQGAGKLGSAKITYPSLILQYHFGTTDWRVRPYVGAGPTYVIIYDEKSTASLDGLVGAPVDVDFGNDLTLSLQAGVRWHLNKKWAVNFAAAYIDFTTKEKLSISAGIIQDNLDVTTLVLSGSVVYKF
jgi:outer membrane protein